MDSLGPRIKELRLEASLNKAALARKVGVSDVTIYYWESGAIRQIGHERLVALAQALGCPLSRLLEGDSGSRTVPLYLGTHPPAPPPDPPPRPPPPPLEPVAPPPRGGGCYPLGPPPPQPSPPPAAGDPIACRPTHTPRH